MYLTVRIVAFVFALLWATLGFALVDLTTALTWRAGWEETLALEASWGALFTFFVVVPLLVLVVRPTRYVETGVMSAVVALSLVAGAAIASDPVTLILAGVVLLTGAVIVGLGIAAHRRRSETWPRPRVQPSWLLIALAVAGIPLWGPYIAHTSPEPVGVPPSVTIAFDHWPVQAALGVAILLASVLAAVVVEMRSIAVWACALSAAVIGVIMALSLQLPVATESPVWCIWAVLWGVGMALALPLAPVTRPWRATAQPRAAVPSGDEPLSPAGD